MSGSSEEKTELPTEKKLEDALEEGQAFKFKEILYFFNVILVISTVYFLNFGDILEVALDNIGNVDNLKRYLDIVKVDVALAFIIPIVVSIVSVALPSLLQTKFVLATKALKLDFSKLNPVTGVKNLFSVKTIIELVKAIIVHIVGISFLAIWFFSFGKVIFELVYLDQYSIATVLLNNVVLFVCFTMLVIFISTLPFIFFEHKQFIEDQKMTKQDVKRENKDQNGSPEIKGRRNEINRSLMNEKDESDIKRSAVILANPTHLAVGIYFDMLNAPIPFISLKHKGYKAMEVFRIAKENDIPIIRNKKLTRAIYKNNNKHTLIIDDNLIKVLYLLHWLQNVEYRMPVYDETDIDVW